MESLHFELIREERPGDTFKRLFERNWPAYKAWYLDEGEALRPTYLECTQALQTHMPELYPLYQDMIELLDADDLQARFLSLYCPPPFYSGCSQLVLKAPSTALIRNYDFPPILCEGIISCSRWLGKKVIAMTDCLWGALDGMNESGLAVSIAYGGQMLKGEGFGITIVMRYVLETCSNVEDAIAVFRRIPVHLDYNIAILDASGQSATLYLTPGGNVSVTEDVASTNHQGEVQPGQTLFLEDSLTRLDTLNSLPALMNTATDAARQFLSPPLYRSHQLHQSGTLYTAAYYPNEGRVEYLWPDASLNLSFGAFCEVCEQEIRIQYGS